MKLNDFLRRSVAHYLSGTSICLRGPIGRGKTTVAKRVPERLAKALNGTYGLVLLSGPLLNPPDTIGYLMPDKVQREGEIRAHFESMFTEPFWFRTEDGKHISEFDGGIILVDEEDKMDADVKKIIGEAALSGRLGPHVLPKGWRVWFAGNRTEDRSGSTKDFAHLQNRRREINIDDDIDGVVEFLTKIGMNPIIVSFAATNPNVVFEPIPKEIKPWMTPRSLESAGRYLMQVMKAAGLDPMGDDIPTDEFLQEEIAGDVGAGGAAQLFATIELAKHMPRFSDIVANPTKCKVPEAADAQMLVCYTLASRVDKSNIEPVMQYLKRFPEEFTITFGKAAVARDYALVNTPAFGKWTKENASLMMAISDMR